ncbi:heme-binding protein [Bremerella sp. JC770]|uniref:heme-binding protein n=1 Tax=Bremerella sp. JC770 TaxID=3232137 RepID=UPI00345B0BDD
MFARIDFAVLFFIAIALLSGTSPAAETAANAKLDAPLPEGWPEPGKPGEIAVKSYPAYRSAVAKSGATMQRADGVLFWQLFAHIQANQIAMTAPVVNTYSASDDKRQVEMEFLYRTTEQGQTGDGLGQVQVQDHPQQSFVTLVVQGNMNAEVYQQSLKQLKSWLSGNPQWKLNGDPRRLGYHGPMTPQAKRIWEVQIPVESVKME